MKEEKHSWLIRRCSPMRPVVKFDDGKIIYEMVLWSEKTIPGAWPRMEITDCFYAESRKGKTLLRQLVVGQGEFTASEVHDILRVAGAYR